MAKHTVAGPKRIHWQLVDLPAEFVSTNWPYTQELVCQSEVTPSCSVVHTQRGRYKLSLLSYRSPRLYHVSRGHGRFICSQNVGNHHLLSQWGLFSVQSRYGTCMPCDTETKRCDVPAVKLGQRRKAVRSANSKPTVTRRGNQRNSNISPSCNITAHHHRLAT